MFSEEQAVALVEKEFPNARSISRPIDYRGVWLFRIFGDDPDEGELDPFFSVSQADGELRDFSIMEDGNVREITIKFRALEGGSNGTA